jgi:hypothetical protein
MDELFRLSGTLRHDPRIAAWFGDFADPLRLMVQPWFARMRACGPETSEILHDGCPVACLGDAPFGYVNAFRAHANIGFFHGAALADPAGLLEGQGKRMRYVKLRPGAARDAAALEALIAAAYGDIRQRLARGAYTKGL